MTTKLGWRELFVILTVLPCCWSLQVSIAEREYEAARGSEITLSCSFTPARPITNALVLTWEAYPKKAGEPMDLVATYFINNPIDIAPKYEGRAFVEVNHQVSTLRLTGLTMQDSRSYQCSVMIPNDDEGTTAATTSLLVLVPPSPPICQIQGEAAYWHNISLTCMSEEGSPLPTYEWKRFSVQNIPRPFPLKTTEKDGALSLFNISSETSGFYICTSRNQIGVATCNFTLAVTPGGMNVGSTAAIIGGVLAGVALLGIVVFCYCKKKGKKDKNAEGSPGEVAFYDRDAPEAGEQYRDENSKDETKQVNQQEVKGVVPQNYYSVGAPAHQLEDDPHSYNSGKERHDGKGSDVDSRHNQDDQHDRIRGSRDRLDDDRSRRNRLDDDRDRGSRDHLDDKRNHYSGSRDRLGDQGDRSGGSRDRLDDQRDYSVGSQDRLDNRRDRYGGSRDRLDDQRDNSVGSRDCLDNQRERYGGSRDRLDERHDRHGGSRDRLDDQYDRHGGSRDYTDDQNRNRY
ncbi:cell surface A33 antigen [Cottoperca gobio]|uniref:Cell surface A33 antigen n=1 Tax=Cottoperca gobio TaxID=56716 RepID=A0A6J2S175_COTGO|nr:cell surface A33 antigen [Cottoperca gobio]